MLKNQNGSIKRVFCMISKCFIRSEKVHTLSKREISKAQSTKDVYERVPEKIIIKILCNPINKDKSRTKKGHCLSRHLVKQ